MASTAPRFDAEVLQAVVLRAVPNCTAAVVVGSSVTRDLSLVRDIDVTGFSPDMAIDAERRVSTTFMDRRLDIVLHHPAYFRTIIEDDHLLFLNLRELRKLVDGFVILDLGGELTSTIALIKTKRTPIQFLARLSKSLRPRQYHGSIVRERFAFLLAFENLIFAWLHLEERYRFSKHKWLVSDSRAISCQSLNATIAAIAEEYGSATNVHHLVDQLTAAFLGIDRFRNAAQPMETLDDARTLLKFDRVVDAVFPLRYAALSAVWHYTREIGQRDAVENLTAAAFEMSDQAADLQTAITSVLLLTAELRPGLIPLYIEAVQAFEQAYQNTILQRRSGNSVPDWTSIRHEAPAIATSLVI